MKRPLAVVGFTLTASLLVLCFADSTCVTVAAGAAALAVFAVCFVIKSKCRVNLLPVLTSAMTVFAACNLLLCYEAFAYLPALTLAGEKVQITATVTDYPVRDGDRYHVTARLNTDKLRRVGVRLSLAAYSKYDEELEDNIAALEPDDTVVFTGTIYALGGANAAVERSFKSRGLYLGAYPTGKVSLIKAQSHGLSFYIKRERKKTINQLRSAFEPDCAGLLISVLLGDKTYLSDEIYSCFRNAGAAHIMAVSGLHLSVWILFVLSIMEKLLINRRRASIFLMGFVVLIMAFACFSGSVMRAGIMMLVYLLGFALRRTSDPLNSLGMAAAVIMLINPFMCLSISFQLSFLSTLAIIIFALPLSQRISGRLRIKDGTVSGRILSAVIDSVMISVSVSAFTAPVLIYSFGKLSLLSVVTNLLFLPAVMPLIVCSGLYVMFYFVPVLSWVLSCLARIIAYYCIFCARLIGTSRFSVVTFPERAIPLLTIVFAVCLAAVTAVRFKRSDILRAAVCAAVSLCVAASFSAVVYYRQMTVTVKVCAVGNGMCVTVSHGKKASVIGLECDDYHAEFVREAAVSGGADVDCAIIQDGEKVNADLLSSLAPERIICPQGEGYIPLSLRSALDEGAAQADMDGVHMAVSGGAVTVTACGVDILITSGGARPADIVITDSVQTALDCEAQTAIFSGESATDGIISTADGSGISINIKRNGNFSVTGENSWLYLTKSN